MESILYACLPDDIVVIRVLGRGNHVNSAALRGVLDRTSTRDRCPFFIFDLEKCTAMDSTFLGVLASFALRQQQMRGSKAIAVHLSRQVRESLELLGLKYVLDLRAGEPPGGVDLGSKGARFSAAPAPEIGKVDRIVMMIEAHERLIDIDGENEIKFRGVLQSLRESLDRNNP